jgi:hypothetical protein
VNEKSFKAALQRIARRRTARHVDIWARIEPQLRPVKPRHHRGFSVSLRWATMITAGMIALLFVGAGAYAKRHYTNYITEFDQGLQQAHDNQLGRYLAESQTIEGVTATLDWVYADQHRVTVFYSVTQADAPYRQLVSASVNSHLLLSGGTELPQIFGGGGGGSGGGGGGSGPGSEIPPTPIPKISWEFSGSANFDATSITGNPSALTLQLDLHPQLQVELVDQAPGEQPTTIEPVPFTFDFSVPFIPAVVTKPQISQTVNDTTISLEQMSTTPSSTLLTLCMGGLRSDLIWLPEATVDTGQGSVPDLGFIGIAPKTYRSGNQACAVLDFLVPYRGKPEEWILTIDRLYGMFPQDSTRSEVIDGPWFFQIPIAGK